jgi:hypothetical protein
MWGVVWAGAAISISVAFFFQLRDPKLHSALVLLLGSFLGLVIFLMVANDRPFVGGICIHPDSYQLILDTVLEPR